MEYISKYKAVIKVLVVLGVLFLVIVFTLKIISYQKNVLINGQVFNVEVADNPFLLTKGLSGHAPLSPNEGMLFVFEKIGDHGIWMKDMNFSIDIVWINENNQVVHIEEAVSPKTYPKIFNSNLESLYVLEIASGEVDRINLKKGDMVEFLKNSSRKLSF